MGNPYSCSICEDRGFSVGVTTQAESGSTKMFGTDVSDIQSNVEVGDSAITGTLKYLTSGSLVDTWGEGNFLCLKFSGDAFSDAKSIKVGLDPSAGSGLVEVKNDPDRNGAFFITNTSQVFVVEVTDADDVVKRRTYNLSGLVLEKE